MTSPVVVVTRDRDGHAVQVVVAEDERAMLDLGAAATLTFDAAHNLWWGVSHRVSTTDVRLATNTVMWRLTDNPWADITDLETHTCAEPGAPLEPIPGRAAAGTPRTSPPAPTEVRQLLVHPHVWRSLETWLADTRVGLQRIDDVEVEGGMPTYVMCLMDGEWPT